MSNSKLINYKKISPNKYKGRTHAIDTTTIHCMACDWTIERCGESFADPKRGASSNYGIGSDGRRALYVDEKDGSWCSSNKENDMRAITIEVACEPKHPYKITDKALSSLIELLVDICQRNGIKRLKWSDNKNDRINHKNGCNMTVHRDFAAKACPGDYLYNLHSEIAKKVNLRLEAAELNQTVPYKVKTTKEVKLYNKLGGAVARTVGKDKTLTVGKVVAYGSYLYGVGQKTGQFFRLKNTDLVTK